MFSIVAWIPPNCRIIDNFTMKAGFLGGSHVKTVKNEEMIIWLASWNWDTLDTPEFHTEYQ